MSVMNFRQWVSMMCSVLICGASCLLQPAHAANESSVSSPLLTIDNTNRPQGNWFVGVGGGMSWINLPSSTTVINGTSAPPPSNQDTFSINDPTDAIFQANAGYRWVHLSDYFPYYAIFAQYRHYFKTHIEGNVEQFSLSDFENYNYKMSYEADMFTLNGKVDLMQYKKLLPYLSGGVGFILNHVSDYSESALSNVTPRTSPGYKGNTTNSFAVTLGAGIDYILTEDYWITVGYEHVFQGDLKSGPGAGSWSNTALNFGEAKMDTVFINFSANFPQGFWR